MKEEQLGHWLCERGLLDHDQLAHALEAQAGAEPRPTLGAMLTSLGHIDEDRLTESLATMMGVQVWDLDAHPPAPELKGLIPPALAQECLLVAQANENGYLRCAVAGPISPEQRAKIEFLVNRPIRIVLAAESALTRQLQELYGLSVETMIEGLAGSEDSEGKAEDIYVHDLRQMAQEPTLINLVNMVISKAIEDRASDIHVEPFEAELKIKYRIDGTLIEMAPPPKEFQSAIVSRIKIMAGMDIAERYIPQDGQIRVNLPDGRVDIRVSTVPTIHGESVVLRLLNKDESLLKLPRLGMPPATHERFTRLLELPYGILLACGPTGSGKTTTLYSGLIQIYTPEKKIITIEDPVEYEIAGVNQIPVRPKRGLTFASGLRSILRQDPDIIMVGEIRDRETADIAIRAALTGHLVFSTLHTNDAPGAVTRLLDMGVEPFLIASSIQGVLGQRLVRRLCESCRRAVQPEFILRKSFEVADLPPLIYEPAGCERCNGRGFYGRIGLFELLVITQKLHDLILQSSNSSEVKKAAASQMQTMRQDGWEKIKQGLTSAAEVLQATRYDTMDEG